jgi:hypothetical protein
LQENGPSSGRSAMPSGNDRRTRTPAPDYASLHLDLLCFELAPGNA